MNSPDTYNIKIRQFEGPFDLLLFFIERDEIDIMDIPISRITSDFLQYIRTLEQLNINVASEFILTAATLMKIKSKLLIPRPEYGIEGDEVDPRVELAQKLIEYKKFKDVIDSFSEWETERFKMAYRGYSKYELKTIASHALIDAELESLSIHNLFKAFDNVLKEMKVRQTRPSHVIYKYNHTIKNQRNYISTLLQNSTQVTFNEIFTDLTDRIHAIVTFLSILEMINEQLISLIPGNGPNNFWIRNTTG